MPRGDRTGPYGQGPMTGRGMGYCRGYDVPGYMNYYGGRGYGFGRHAGYGWGRGAGFGRGWGWHPAYYHHPYYPAEPVKYDKEQEIEFLKRSIQAAQENIKFMEERLGKLEDE